MKKLGQTDNFLLNKLNKKILLRSEFFKGIKEKQKVLKKNAKN